MISRLPEPQCASTVLMVRPHQFAWNPQTQASNAIQRFDEAPPAERAQVAALAEFECLVATLREAGVQVLVVDDSTSVWTPDAVFPNNWFSTHADGRFVLYPMLAPNRRAERRADVYEEVLPQAGFAVSQVIDLSDHEEGEVFLEGTGSLVLDRVYRVAYGCRSARTHDAPAAAFARAFGYELELFDAYDEQGAAIYHTNVMMAMGEQFAVICSDAITGADRNRVLERLEDSGRDVLDISQNQLSNFAGNVLELSVAGRKNVLAMSRSAHDAFSAPQLARLSRLARPLPVDIDTIELCSGGQRAVHAGGDPSPPCRSYLMGEIAARERAEQSGIQPALAPRNTCYGCGPSSDGGLHLISYPTPAPSREIVAHWQPAERHQAFPGVLNGGVIGTLLDCHSNWAAIWYFLHEDGGETPRCCVTGEFTVRLRRATPLGPPVQLRARVDQQPGEDRVVVSAELSCEGELCATCRGVFFSVGEDHPAHHAW